MTIDDIFDEEEHRTAASMPITDEILVHAFRSGTQAFSEFGHVVMEPVFRGQLNLSLREAAVAVCFYRLLGAVRTLSDLRAGYQFQTIAGCARLVFELCVDTHLLCGPNAVDRSVEKFHGFTRAARFKMARKTVDFYKQHPQLEDPGDAEERRARVETPDREAEINTLCRDLWGESNPPSHWSGLTWRQQVRQVGPEVEERFVQWSQSFAWHVHGGGAGVSGLSRRAFHALEVICHDTVTAMLPETYRFIGVEMHMHHAIPTFFEDLWRVRDQVRTCAVIDAQLVSLGRRSKLVIPQSASDAESTA